jgi:hypothetical protein
MLATAATPRDRQLGPHSQTDGPTDGLGAALGTVRQGLRQTNGLTDGLEAALGQQSSLSAIRRSLSSPKEDPADCGYELQGSAHFAEGRGARVALQWAKQTDST